MKKQITPILLILMMLVTPIASAFDHCSGMDMSSHLLENQSFSMSSMGKGSLIDKEIVKVNPSNKADMDCHSNNSCTFHACGGYGIISSSLTINTKPSWYYSDFEYISPRSNISPSLLRPPIANL
jgi:hypothetical protein